MNQMPMRMIREQIAWRRLGSRQDQSLYKSISATPYYFRSIHTLILNVPYVVQLAIKAPEW